MILVDFLKVFLSNQKNSASFKELKKEFLLLRKKYANSFKTLNQEVESKVSRREYAKGGKTIHRGFFSPSALDLVISGCRRGRLLKRPPEGNHYDYEYLFDSKGKMICVKKYSDEFNGVFSVISIELFVYEGNRVLAFEFEPFNQNKISFITECYYENKQLISYKTAVCPSSKKCIEINVETFEYQGELLQSVYWYSYEPLFNHLENKKYVFSRDEEGYISTYTVQQLDSFENEVCGPYKAFGKRK